MLLDQTGDVTPVHFRSSTHNVCSACGGVHRKVRARRNMPAPVIAPNPYDVAFQPDQAAQQLLDQGKAQVAALRARVKRLEFAERASRWTPDRIQEEMDKIDSAVAVHEGRIAECLRQRMILEDQLAQAVKAPGVGIVSGHETRPSAPMTPAVIRPDPDACPF